MFNKVNNFVENHEKVAKIAGVAIAAGIGAYLGVRLGIKNLKIDLVISAAEGTVRTAGKMI